MAAWWVNQHLSYKPERDGKYLWAPKRSANGRRVAHWETMKQVAAGERVLNYVDGVVRSVCTVERLAGDKQKPAELPVEWGHEGLEVLVRYENAIRPIRLADIPLEWRFAEGKGSPFNKTGGVNQGYLYPLSESFAEQFFARFGERFSRLGSPLLPPEAEDSAVDLLRRLLGADIHTVSGRVNRVLRIEPPAVIVGTEQSPQGAPVPIAAIQAALDQLKDVGSVVIDPPDVGYRSAFVGAVLLTLPGAQAAGSPPVITIRTMPGDAGDERSMTFEGDLERPREGAARGEQARLRDLLFGSTTHAQCGFCGATLPVRFLHAAHIKQRSTCTDQERRDLSNIAMSACLFGCDALYELGFIAVAPDGTIEASPKGAQDPSLRPHLERLVGRRCLVATSGRASYFAWHRANKFRA